MNLAMKTMALAGVFCLCAATPLFAQTHALQVRKAGDGSGSVRDCRAAGECFGEQIACGATCLAEVLDGASVLLNAVPDDGSAFGGWLVNGEPPASQDLQMTQDVTVTATFIKQADAQPPVVTVNIDRESLPLGGVVTISTTATDNVGVTEFHLTVNGSEIAAAPGRAIYTPTAVGQYLIAATAHDAAGNTTTATQRLYVRGEVMTVSFFEAVDIERGVSYRDLNNVALAPGDMNAVRTVILPPESNLFAFSPDADGFFSFRDRAVMLVPIAPAALAVLRNTPYETVTASALDSAALSSDAAGVSVASTDTVVIKTAEGGYAKLGHLQANPAEWTLQFSHAMLTP